MGVAGHRYIGVMYRFDVTTACTTASRPDVNLPAVATAASTGAGCESAAPVASLADDVPARGDPRATGSRPRAGVIDYRLARRASSSEYRKGRLARHEVCDAHPELLRAAAVRQRADRRWSARSARTTDVVLVTYVFGPRLPALGRCITTKAELAKLAKGRSQLACLRGRGLPVVLLEPPGPHVPRSARRRDARPPTPAPRRPAARRLRALGRLPDRSGRAARRGPRRRHRRPLPAPAAPRARRARRAPRAAGERPQRPLALAARPLPGRARRGRGGRRASRLVVLEHRRCPPEEPAAADVVHLRGRRHRGLRPGQRHRHASAPRRTGSTCTSTRSPTCSSGGRARRRGPRLLRARRRRPRRHRPGRCTPTSAAAGVQQGGSTITQQYVKNVYLTSERTIARKLKEAVLAVKLERELEKDEILERYLNTIYFGRGAYGVQAASPRLLRQGRRASIGLPEAVLPRRPDPRARAAPTPLATPRRPTRRRRDGARRDARGGLHRPGRAATAADAVADRDATSSSRAIAPRGSAGTATRPTTRSAPSTSSSTSAGSSPSSYGEDDALRRRPAGLHDARPRHAAGRLRRGHRDARPARRPRRPRSSPSTTQGQVKAMVGGRDFEARRGEPGRSARERRRLGPASPARRSSRSSWPRRSAQGISLELDVRRARLDDVPRRAGREAGEDWKVRQLRRHASRACSTSSRPPGTRPTPSTPSSCSSSGPQNVADLADQLGHRPPSCPRCRRSCSAPARCRCSTWPPPTPPSPTAACTTTRRDHQGRAGRRGRRRRRARPGRARRASRCSTEEQADIVTYCLRGGRRGRHRARRPASASPPPARPAPPRTTATPGSSATPRKLTAAVWMGYPRRCPTAGPAMDDDATCHGRRRRAPAARFPPRSGSKFMRDGDRGRRRRRLPDEPHDVPGRGPQRRRSTDHHHRAPTASDRRSTTDVDARRPRPSSDTTTTAATTSRPTTTDRADHRRRPRPPTDGTARAGAARPVAQIGLVRVAACGTGSTSARPRRAPRPSPRLVPRLGGDVDAVHGDDLVVLVAAAVAVPHVVHRPQATDGPSSAAPVHGVRCGTAGSRVALDGKEVHAMRTKLTAPAVRARKVRDGGDPLVMVTAYDAPGARMADEAGVDLILVGDSVAMVVLGYDDTLQVTVDDMAHHTARPVARAKPRRPLVVGDLPWMSYHVSRRGHRAQRRHADPGRRPGGEARGRAQAAADDRGHRRRRDPGDGPPRPHPAVGARHGRLQGAGPGARAPRCALVDDAKALAARRLLRHRARGRARRGGPHGHRRGRRAHHRHRRRPATATARCSCSTTCSASRTGSRRSSCAATPSLKADARRGHRRASPPTCAPAPFPADDESYHLSAEVAETLGLYGLAPIGV